MTWNDTKSTFSEQTDVPADEKITASEYNNLVAFLEARHAWQQTTESADYTASAEDSVWVDASSQAVTVTLPAPSAGALVRALAIDATNGVTVSQNASEGINDTSGSQSTLSLSGGEAITIGSDGSTWWVLSRVTVGGAFSGDHADLTNVTSYQHHTKTTSASDLTDVSADSVADAHHTRLTAGDGLTDDADTFNIEPADFAGAFLSDDGSDTLQVDTDGTIEDDGSGNARVRERFSYDPGVTQFEDGQTNTELNRIVLQSGETLTIERIELRGQGGGSSTSVDIEVYDATAANSIGSQTLGGTTKAPGSSGAGNTVVIRYSNSSGGQSDAAPRVTGYIEGA